MYYDCIVAKCDTNVNIARVKIIVSSSGEGALSPLGLPITVVVTLSKPIMVAGPSKQTIKFRKIFAFSSSVELRIARLQVVHQEGNAMRAAQTCLRSSLGLGLLFVGVRCYFSPSLISISVSFSQNFPIALQGRIFPRLSFYKLLRLSEHLFVPI